jgi:hypothetical protein
MIRLIHTGLGSSSLIAHVLHSLDFGLWSGYFAVTFWTLEWVVRGYVGIHRAQKAIQVDGCRPRQMSLRRFPQLFPIRNPYELRGLYCRSYFGPRTCGGGITNVIEVGGALNPGFPFSPIEGGVMRMSHFICQTLWNTSFEVVRRHPQGPESDSGRWLPATSDLALSYPELFQFTGPLQSLVLRTEPRRTCGGGITVTNVIELVTCVFECVVTVSSTGAKNRFKEMTTATSGVLARFPLLLPIRNPCELRGLCRHSYFGPRTFGGGVTNVIEVSGLLIRVSPSHP